MRQILNLQTGELTFDEDAPVTPQTHEEIQAKINAEALAYLSNTDWYVVRFAETGTPIAIDVLTKRAEARLLVV